MMQNGCINKIKRTTNTDNMGKLSSLRQGYGWHSCHTFCFAPALKTAL